MREAERLRELEKLGRPANYDLLARDERHRIDANERQRRHREGAFSLPGNLPRPEAGRRGGLVQVPCRVGRPSA